MESELAFLDATAQAALVQRGEVSPLELVDAAINRIERVGPQVNSVVIRALDQARAPAASPALPPWVAAMQAAGFLGRIDYRSERIGRPVEAGRHPPVHAWAMTCRLHRRTHDQTWKETTWSP